MASCNWRRCSSRRSRSRITAIPSALAAGIGYRYDRLKITDSTFMDMERSMNTSSPAVIRRPDMGLAIAGTRITLYTIIEYLDEGWSQQEVGDWLNLTAEQIQAALDYIDD